MTEPRIVKLPVGEWVEQDDGSIELVPVAGQMTIQLAEQRTFNPLRALD